VAGLQLVERQARAAEGLERVAYRAVERRLARALREPTEKAA
jgi:hypothetical protein